MPLARRAIWSVDKDQAIVRVATMSALLSATAAERRFVLILFEAFALAALVLAAAGIYGVLAGSVAERTREIGVRCSAAARRRDILGMVVGQGMTLTAVGVAIGIAGAVAATERWRRCSSTSPVSIRSPILSWSRCWPEFRSSRPACPRGVPPGSIP